MANVERHKKTVAFLVILLLRRLRRRRSVGRNMWAREWIMRSQQQGAYPNLLLELNAEYSEAFRQFYRLDKEFFETILAMVALLIIKQDTNMRKCLLQVLEILFLKSGDLTQ